MKTQFNLSVDVETAELVRQESRECGMIMSAWVEKAIRAYAAKAAQTALVSERRIEPLEDIP